MTKHSLVMVTERESRGHVHPPISAMVGDTSGDLDDPADQPLHRPLDLFTLQVELTQQVKEVVSQQTHLETCLVGVELVATGLVPTKSVLAFLDPVLDVGPAVVRFHDFLGRQSGVGHDEAHPGEQLAKMPLDLADYPAIFAPATSAIWEIEDAHLHPGPWPATSRSAKVISDHFFQNLVLGQTNEVGHSFALAVIVNLGLGESGVAPKPKNWNRFR